MTEFEVFTGALGFDDVTQRADYLYRTCADDVTLRQRIEDLLRSHAERRFMEGPAEGLTGVYSPQQADRTGHDPGSSIGPYRLVRKLGEGGMGVVYEAVQQGLNRTVAVKMLRNAAWASSEDVQRFRLEAEAIAQLDHPNIIPVYEVGEQDGVCYFSMKLVENGGNLSDKIRELTTESQSSPRHPHLREHCVAVVKILSSISGAVHYAHQHGILHRDLKPANILLDNDQYPYVTDFGLAKRMSGDSHLTQTGAIVGTPSYMAPEQVRGQKALTTAVDVYAFGAILYEVLTGRPPFRGATPTETLMQILEREPERPRTVNPTADADLEAVCMKCLAREPHDRYESAADLAADLERWQNGETLSVRPPRLASLFRLWIRHNFGSGAWIVILGVVWGLFGGGTGLLAVFNPQWVEESWRGAGLLFSECLGASIGLIASALIRPRNAMADLAAGLTTGLLAGVIAYTISWGWLGVLIAGVPYGIWVGMFAVLALLSFSGVYGTVVAGSLLRRHQRVGLIIGLYYELVITGVMLVHVSLGVCFRGWLEGFGRYAMVFPALPVMALAIVGAIRRWHWSVRILLHVAWVGLLAVGVATVVGSR